jgi:hypothetical protein
MSKITNTTSYFEIKKSKLDAAITDFTKTFSDDLENSYLWPHLSNLDA